MRRWWRNVFSKKPKRLNVRCLTYSEADKLIKETEGAWTIAPEEDYNTRLGIVYLELLDKP